MRPVIPGPSTNAATKRGYSPGVRSHCSRLVNGGSSRAQASTSRTEQTRSNSFIHSDSPSKLSPMAVPNSIPRSIQTQAERGRISNSATLTPLSGQMMLQASPKANRFKAITASA